MADHIGSINESTLGASDLDGLSNPQRSQVFGDIAGGVGLDEEIEIARLVVAGNWGVRADNFLGGAIGLLDVGANRDMLANWEAKNGTWRGELESVTASSQHIGKGNIVAQSMTNIATL